MAASERLVDLHCKWLWQYAAETTLFGPEFCVDVKDWLRQLDGYLQGTAAAVLACARKVDDWNRQHDAWASMGELIARCEAEFPGRLLIGPEDVRRWRAEPLDGLCWGVLCVAGFDFLVRDTADLDRLPALFERGVRVFQLVEGEANLLAGSTAPGDDRGLTELGRAFLSQLENLVPIGAAGPKPIVDIAHLNSRSTAEVLDWVENKAVRAGSLALIYSHGAVEHERVRAHHGLSRDNLARLRMLGGTVGFTPSQLVFRSREELKASIEAAASLPFKGRPGYEGLAIGTDFLGIGQAVPGLADVAQIAKWIVETFDHEAAGSLIARNGLRVLLNASGA